MASSSSNKFQGEVTFDVSQAISKLKELQAEYIRVQQIISDKTNAPTILNSAELKLQLKYNFQKLFKISNKKWMESWYNYHFQLILMKIKLLKR